MKCGRPQVGLRATISDVLTLFDLCVLNGTHFVSVLFSLKKALAAGFNDENCSLFTEVGIRRESLPACLDQSALTACAPPV